jgi:hypothetical protein
MEEGFIVDHTYGGAAPPEWTKGPIEKSFWVGVKIQGKERRPVKTYRCPGCGLLESYAGAREA